MIPPEVLNRKSLFSLLYKIDLDLAEQTRARRCPFAGVRCTAPTTHGNLEVGPLNLRRRLKFDLASVVVGRVAVAVFYRHRCVFGAAVYTGRLCCCWLRHCARGKIRPLPSNDSRQFARYGGQPSTGGESTFEIFFPRVPVTGACPVI